MSLEYKSLEVANEDEEVAIRVLQRFGWRLKSSQRIFNQNARPVGAIIYQNNATIFSRTETVDFTKILLERDTNMPHYQRIAALEEEFFELAEQSTLQRPLPPQPLMPFDTWAKSARPKIFSTLPVLVSVFCIAILFPTIIATILSGETASAMLPIGLLVSPAVFGLIKVIEIFLRNRAIVDERSPFRKKIQAQYDRYRQLHFDQLKKIELYDYAAVRLSEISKEVSALLNNM